MTPPSESFHDGQIVFERFGLSRKLGQGGMGEVWLANDVLLEKKVALKFLPGGLVRDLEAYEMLKKEAQKAMLVTHPNIVRVHDFHRTRELAAISMEYVEGTTLASLKEERPEGAFEPHELQKWLGQLCEALEYAHTKVNLVHRDLKPANLMVDLKGDLKIADFGLSAHARPLDGLGQYQGQVSGTLVFMSPQQLTGSPCQPSDDIYSLGATLYDLLTGLPPFFEGAIPEQILRQRPPSIRERREEFGLLRYPIAGPWEAVIARCLAKDPLERPASAKEVGLRLLNQVPITMPEVPVVEPPVEAVPKFKRPQRKEPVVRGEPEEAGGTNKAKNPSNWGQPEKKGLPWVWLVVTMALVFGGVAWWALGPKGAQAEKVVEKGTAAEVSAEPQSQHLEASQEKTAEAAGLAQEKGQEGARPAGVGAEVPSRVKAAEAATSRSETVVPAEPSQTAVIDCKADWGRFVRGGALVLIDRAARELCLWPGRAGQQEQRLALSGLPVCEAYGPAFESVFIGFDDGRIVQISVAGGTLGAERVYTRHPYAPGAMLAVGKSMLVAGGSSSSWWEHFLYDGSGRRMDVRKNVFRSRYLVWSEKQRRVFFLTEGVSPVDVHYEEVQKSGKFGKTGDSPFHNSAGMTWPLHLLGRGESVVLGSGRVLNSLKLELDFTLPVKVRFLKEMKAGLFVIEGGTNPWGAEEPKALKLMKLRADYTLEEEASFAGVPVALGEGEGGPVAVAVKAGKTYVYAFDSALKLLK